MNAGEEEFLHRLRATFKVEAEEHILAISTILLDLEKTPESEGSVGQIETVFRAAHTLKGAARAVSLVGIEAICQSLEQVFSIWKRKEIRLAAENFDVLHRAIDLIGKLARSDSPEPSTEEALKTSTVTRELRMLTAPAAPRAEEAPSPIEREAKEPLTTVPLPDTVRVSTAKLDRLLLRAEELLTLKQAAAQRVADLRGCESLFNQWTKKWHRVEADLREARSGATTNALLEFLDWNQGHMKLIDERLRSLSRAASEDSHTVAGLLDDLVADSKKLVMLPFSTLSDPLPMLVRDLCRDQGKEADLVVRGGEVEIDKRILEEMKDALVHLLRNCVDHGIETPEIRIGQKKPARATITILVSRLDNGKVEIKVSDDGRGIALDSVREAAIRRGLISAASMSDLSDEEGLRLIFQSEVSTSPMITEISGRGLGLAIVREKTEKLGGHVSIETEPHKGTTFRLSLPLTLATFRGVLVRVAGREFVLPISNVERVARIRASSIQTVEGRETIALNDAAVSLSRLEVALEMQRAGSAPSSEFLSIIVLALAGERIAFAVDEVVHEEEVLVKSLASPLSRVRNISGATILGSGKVVPILNVADLMKSAKKRGFTAPKPEEEPAAKRETKRKRILVAEDSITSRMLLKNIMESAGHEVKTAVDGVAALTELRTGEFDLVVSDIEMPRMTGFDLVTQIRADRKLASLPVILVTALASREDREKGVDVGANAYIVKSSFDQSNLLDAIRRLA